jgi:hypothetical protein
VVGGIPTAQLMSVLFALGAFLLLIYRHGRPGTGDAAADVPPVGAAEGDLDADLDDDDDDFDDEFEEEGGSAPGPALDPNDAG